MAHLEWNHELQDFYIPKTVHTIEPQAFRGLYNLRSYSIDIDNVNYITLDGVLFTHDGSILIAYPSGSQQEVYTIPNEVKKIEADAFRNVWALKEIGFEEGSILEHIGAYAFNNSQIKQLTLPEGIKYIDYYAFAWNHNLMRVTIPRNTLKIDYYAFYGGNPGMLIFVKDDSQPLGWHSEWNIDRKTVYFGDIEIVVQDGYEFIIKNSEAMLVETNISTLNEFLEIPSTVSFNNENIPVTSIASGVFSNHYEIEIISIPKSIKHIGSRAFADSYNLREIRFAPDALLEVIGHGAFRNTGLISVVIPASVKTIEEEAFSNIYALRELTFEENSQLTAIKRYSFAWNYQLNNFTIPNNVEHIESSAFSGSTNLSEFIVSPDHSLFTTVDGTLYSKDMTRLIAYPSGKPKDKLLIPSSVITIERDAFRNARSLRSVEFLADSQLTTIGREAFANSGIRNISLPSGLLYIQDYAFAWNYNLGIIFIPDTVTQMDYGVF